ncbi:MAG: Flp family type IVb pilin [Chloroflexi bacterium]|nr:Flp family type IVb pilin [Chloroflexota bacterium]
MNLLNKGISTEEGATAVEYSMMVVFIAAAVVALVRTLGLTTLGLFQGLVSLWP